MTNCLFCNIVARKIPSFAIHEDDDFLVILDRFPQCLGHALILPKAHAVDLFDLPADTAAKVLPLAQTVAARLREVLQCDGLNLIQNNGTAAGQVVLHYHLHLVPRFEGDGMEIKRSSSYNPTDEEFAAFLAKYRA